METIDVPPLTWVFEPIPECLACGGAIEPEEAELAVAGPDGFPDGPGYLAVMGRCQACGRWYSLIDTLQEIAEREAWSFDALRAFRVEGEAREAAVQLGPDGLMRWDDFRAQQARAREAAEAPPPEPEEVRTLKPADAAWEVGVCPATWFGEGPDTLELAYLALVLDDDGLIRANSLHDGASHDTEALDELVRRAAARPAPQRADAARPPEVLLSPDSPAAAHAEALSGRLDASGIALRTAPTGRIDDALREAVANVSEHGEDPYFAAHDDDEIRAFYEAARAFYDAAPWRRIEGQKYLAFRLDEGPWGFLNVMGQMEEEPGLSIFDDFLHLCRFLHNAPHAPAGPLAELFGDVIEEMGGAMGGGPEDQLRAAGAVEGVTLGPLAMLHPQDGARLLRLIEEGSLEPVAGAEYPLVHRYAADAMFATPRLPLSAYRALLDAVREAVARRRADPITSVKETFTTTGEHAVDLRYPSKGEKILPRDPRGVRLVVHIPDDAEVGTEKAAGLRIDAPGEARLSDLARTIQRDTENPWYPTAFGNGEAPFWDNRSRRAEPSPYAFQLPTLSGGALWMEEAWDRYPMRAETLSAAETPEEVRVARNA